MHKQELCWEMYGTSPAVNPLLMRLGAVEYSTCPEALNFTKEVDRGDQQEQCEAEMMGHSGKD